MDSQAGMKTDARGPVLVLGATGRTGTELVARALGQGRAVTALVRDPSRLAVEHDRLRTVTGDATDVTALEAATAGQDAVLCALGPTSPRALLGTRLMRDTAAGLLPAMARNGVGRLVMLSALGAGTSARVAPRLLRASFATVLRRVGEDKAEAEASVRASDVDWTIVYPPALASGAGSGGCRSGPDLELRGLPKLARADLAEFMLAQLESPTYRRTDVVLGPAP
jgi:putative NADH-flavin reductase